MIKLFLDMDGILTDFHSAAMEYFDIPKDTVFPANDFDTVKYMCAAKSKAIGVNTFWEQDFWKLLDVKFWSQMLKTKECNDILKVSEQIFEDNVCILSSPANGVSAQGKVMWIEENLPSFSHRFLLGKGKAFVAGPQSILVDDRNENVDDFILHGGHALLYPRHWNRRWDEKQFDFMLELSMILSSAQGA